MYVRIEDLGPETFQIPPAAHTVVNYPEGAEAFLENTRVIPDGSGSSEPGQRPHRQLPVGADWPDRGHAEQRHPQPSHLHHAHRPERLHHLPLPADRDGQQESDAHRRGDRQGQGHADGGSRRKPGGPGKGHHHAAGQRHSYPGETPTYLWSGVQTETPGAPILILPTDTASATLTVTAPTGLTADAGPDQTNKRICHDRV